MTKISFTDEHLSIILKALEVYSRLRAGQIHTAMDEAFLDYSLSWEESESIDRFVKSIIFPAPPELKYDGHGGYWDQYGNTYGEDGERDTEITWQEKCRTQRPHLQGNAAFGVAHEEMKKSGGTLAYEIYSTIRQYVALKNNDGYHGRGTDFRDPLTLTGVELPKIEGFVDEKRFTIKGKAIVNKLLKYEESKDWNNYWELRIEHQTKRCRDMEAKAKLKADALFRFFDNKSNYDQLDTLKSFMAGEITHFFVNEYDPKIVTWDDEMYCDDYYRRTVENIKLISLYGKSNGDLEYRICEYYDGSGNNKVVTPCKSYEEALKHAQDVFNVKVQEYLSDEKNLDITRWSKIEGLVIPKEAIDKFNQKKADDAKKRIEKLQEEIDKIKKSI